MVFFSATIYKWNPTHLLKWNCYFGHLDQSEPSNRELGDMGLHVRRLQEDSVCLLLALVSSSLAWQGLHVPHIWMLSSCCWVKSLRFLLQWQQGQLRTPVSGYRFWCLTNRQTWEKHGPESYKLSQPCHFLSWCLFPSICALLLSLPFEM